MNINISKNEKETPNKLYRGFGMVSANNTSRLLIDYKLEHPRRYREILNLVFGENGLDICHLKLEMGSDINSSSGTEPCTMRSETEPADVRRGAGFILASDAKKIKPDLTLDLLYWSEPKWVTDSKDVFAARYKWYKDTLNAAYKEFRLKFDYVSPNRNERAVEPEWIKYFSEKLKSETDCLYDFSKIKIVAADEEGNWQIADLMLKDEKLLSAVDVIGSHYTSHCSENTRLLSDKYGKEVWFSEGCPPMSYSRGTSRFDGSGLGGINGVLDIADRIIAMYPCGCMNMYEFQPVAAACYDGITYGYKQLISAKEPWSGYFSIDNGFYMALHFSLFIKKSWVLADSACFCDGEKGGDGHAVVNAKNSFLTAYDPKTNDYSLIICNSSDKEKTYYINVNGLEKAALPLNLWETRGCENKPFEENLNFDENYFKYRGEIQPERSGKGYKLQISVKPCSLVTLSTLDVQRPEFAPLKSEILPLPYYDDFNYNEKRLTLTPSTPKYTTDQGGAFEIVDYMGKKALMQKITYDTKAEEWGATPLPVTCFGDDRWFNYSVSVDVLLEASNRPEENFAGVGLRYSSACRGISGYSLLLYQSGKMLVRKNEYEACSGAIEGIDMSKPHNLKISAYYDRIEFFIDGKPQGGFGCNYFYLSAGRAALYSNYYNNLFFDFKAEKNGDCPYIKRYDNTDPEFVYYGSWEHNLMSGFSEYKRTVSAGKAGAGVKFTFSGTGFGLFGINQYALFTLILDGKKAENNAAPDLAGTSLAKMNITPEVKALNRQTFENHVAMADQPIMTEDNRHHFFTVKGLPNRKHTAELIILRGELRIDGAEVFI